MCGYRRNEERIMGKLDEKTAVITGGTSGIGLATAKLLAREGAHVFITGRRADALAKAEAEIGTNVTPVQSDPNTSTPRSTPTSAARSSPCRRRCHC
jgi:NADP-dependent 3-hydroxy acid dehydrogenase YdfG